ncbi:membrane-associated sensor domain-containing protein [Shewanella sp.]|uniref:membrane-associated sensor domain-containing protein n=1 Tax=Shewanella sp. TaxID=50422 RepID=UPI0035673B83
MLWLSLSSLLLQMVVVLSYVISPVDKMDVKRLILLFLPFTALNILYVNLYFRKFRVIGAREWVWGHIVAIVLCWLVIMSEMMTTNENMLQVVETLCDIIAILLAIALFPSLKLMFFSIVPVLAFTAYSRYQVSPDTLFFNIMRVICLLMLLFSGRQVIYRWFKMAVRRDVEKHRLLKHFRRMALVDGLTGLSNRRHFDEILGQEVRAATRTGHSLCLILMDIDFFKRLNDSLGHQGGDECLKKMGELLSGAASRPRDLAVRYGGEEFALLLPETSLAGAKDIAGKVAELLAEARIAHPDSAIGNCVTVSQGLVKWQAGMDSADLLAAADGALYEAKELGRNQFRVASISAESSTP